MPIKACNKRCDSCAFSLRAAANKEPLNYLAGQLALLGPSPFYCHDNFDWRSKDDQPKTRADIRDREIHLCTGWLEEVRKLAPAGYYKENPLVTKVFAQVARENLIIWRDSDDPDEKKEALEKFGGLLRRLVEKARKFGMEFRNQWTENE